MEQKANLTWVQPRVLDIAQVKAILNYHSLYHAPQLSAVQQRLSTWTERIKSIALSVQTQTPELFQQAFL